MFRDKAGVIVEILENTGDSNHSFYWRRKSSKVGRLTERNRKKNVLLSVAYLENCSSNLLHAWQVSRRGLKVAQCRVRTHDALHIITFLSKRQKPFCADVALALWLRCASERGRDHTTALNSKLTYTFFSMILKHARTTRILINGTH